MTTVVIGVSSTPDYSFLAPIVALAWRDLIGHRPLVLLVGTKDEWDGFVVRNRVVLSALKELDIAHTFVGRLEGYPDATMAQNVRQHATLLKSIGGDEWVMPADADLFPLKRDLYHHHVGTDHRAVITYWNGDHFQSRKAVLAAAASGKRFQTLPTCHVVMRASDWRQIYGLTAGEPFALTVKRTFDAWMSSRVGDRGFDTWMSDQDIMTAKLCAQPWFPEGVPPADVPRAKGGVLFVPRRGHPPGDRLDRCHESAWESIDALKWQDAHMHRAPASALRWGQTLQIIDQVLPKFSSWARDYHACFCEASL